MLYCPQNVERNNHMDIIHIEPTDNVQTINNAIRATKTGDTIIFEPGEHILDSVLQFVSGRSYISRNAIFQCTPELRGPMIELVERPDTEKSRLEKMLSNKPILRKIVTWAFRLLHIPVFPGTMVTGFILHGNGQNTGIQMYTS